MINRRSLAAGAVAACAVASVRAAGFDWSEDIRILRRAYTELHPGLYRYATPDQMAARFDRLEQIFRAGPSLTDAYLALSRVLSSIKCGHTYANFYNQSDATAAALFSGATRLPFHFLWIAGKMVVTANHSGDLRLAPGTEIAQVNGVKSARILKELTHFARADGSNDAKRRALLSVQGTDSYETFDIFHALRFGPICDRLTLRTRGARDAAVSRFDIAPIGLNARRSAMTAAMTAGTAGAEGLGWTLEWRQERVAVLTMPSWVAYNTDWDWQAYLDGVFAEVADRSAQGLIVDLRLNEGGNDCGDDIIARLIDSDAEFDAYRRLVRRRKTPEDLNPYLDTWDDTFRDWGADAEPYDDRYLRLKGENGIDGARIIAPKGPRFRGKVAVLVSAQNSSATFQFASAIKNKGLGKLIGEPTGGNRRGINGGAYFFLRLPRSGLEADLPLIGYFPNTPQPDDGLIPDISAPMTAAAVRDGEDPAMTAALAYATS